MFEIIVDFKVASRLSDRVFQVVVFAVVVVALAQVTENNFKYFLASIMNRQKIL